MPTELPPQYVTRVVQFLGGIVDKAPPAARRSEDGLDAALPPQECHLDQHLRKALRLIGAAVERGDARSARDYLNRVGRHLRSAGADQGQDVEAQHPILTIAQRLHRGDAQEDWRLYPVPSMELARLKLLAAGRNARLTTALVNLEIEIQIHDPDPDKCFRLLGGKGKLKPNDHGGFVGQVFDGRTEFVFYPASAHAKEADSSRGKSDES